ncbi:DUF1405 domain-containing protein [Bacillus coahuilensis]|uniref:DUF1405 domain-containing protein n=1 Tax=Bacillus coahuilensis TaxID=408580 RepID=UPI000A4131CD|nr:DUF1405 domain-containing protein [Bacillus coahuilensis]
MLSIFHLLQNKIVLWWLLIVNVFGTIYGYYWYGYQLEKTEPHFIPFVPDSPTASLFFCFVLIGFLYKKQNGLMEALAIVTLFKYGVWAVVMNLLTLLLTGYLNPAGYMLMASHAAMAIQGILYAPYYKIKPWHIIAAGLWTIHNDIIDYVFLQYPVYTIIHYYTKEIGYFTFWLSIFSIFILYYFGYKRNRKDLTSF